MTPLASWTLVSFVLGGGALLIAGLCKVSGRAAEAEREVTEAELAAALARNRFPRETIVRTVCRACHQQIEKHGVDYRPDVGAVQIVHGMHLACRRGPKIEIHLDDYETAADFARALRGLEGVPAPSPMASMAATQEPR